MYFTHRLNFIVDITKHEYTERVNFLHNNMTLIKLDDIRGL